MGSNAFSIRSLAVFATGCGAGKEDRGLRGRQLTLIHVGFSRVMRIFSCHEPSVACKGNQTNVRVCHCLSLSVTVCHCLSLSDTVCHCLSLVKVWLKV